MAVTSYTNRKNKALSRNIEFNMTKVEYDYLLTLRDLPCAYTGVTFNKTAQGGASLERVDKHGPYSVANCVWVTVQANLLKDKYIDSPAGIHKDPSIPNKKIVDKIIETLGSDSFKKLREDVYMQKSRKVTDQEVAISYLAILEKYNWLPSSLSFNTYKKLYVKTTCDVTGDTVLCNGKSITLKIGATELSGKNLTVLSPPLFQVYASMRNLAKTHENVPECLDKLKTMRGK